jgi:6-phosphogluconolactonase (cycloisomerase 2 family)
MKFSKMRQLIPVSSIGLLAATLLTACSITTIDYVYVASSTGIATLAADSQSGALRSVGSVVTTGASSPVAMVVTSDYANLYVANLGTSASGGSIAHFAIGLNGTLTAKETVNLSDNPVTLAVNSAGTYLYVASCASSATSPTLICSSSGSLTEYAVSSGVIGAATSKKSLSLSGVSSTYATDVVVPTGITVLANNGSDITGNAVYVSVYDQSAYNPGYSTTSSANPGWVFGFTIGSGGALTASLNSPYEAGVKPSAIVSDPTDRFVYVTDYASNDLIGYTILNGSTLSYLTSGPFKTGNEPSAIAIDPRGNFIYVSNALDSTVSAYAITQATGNPTGVSNVTGSAYNSTDTQPVALVVEPALGRFVYTANALGNSISGFRLDATSGALSSTQSTPYPIDKGSKPTAIVAIPHGNHSTQVVAK